MPLQVGRVWPEARCADLFYHILRLLSCCRVKQMTLINHPIITCDKSSRYLENWPIDNWKDKWLQEDKWYESGISDIHCEESGTKHTRQRWYPRLVDVHWFGSPDSPGKKVSITNHTCWKPPENDDSSCKCKILLRLNQVKWKIEAIFCILSFGAQALEYLVRIFFFFF